MRRFLCLFIAVVLLAQPLAAQDLTDVAGAADPEGLPRIEGAAIIGYDQSGFDAFDLPPVRSTYDGADQVRTVEGPRTRIIYAVPGDRSPLEVIRNYQAELDRSGVCQIDYACAKSGLRPGLGHGQPFLPAGRSA